MNPFLLFQVRSRSLNHLDTLEASAVRHQQPDTLSICGSGAVFTDDEPHGAAASALSAAPLHDSISEPDCSMHSLQKQQPDRLLAVPLQTDNQQQHGSSTQDRYKISTTGRRQMLSRSQVKINFFYRF